MRTLDPGSRLRTGAQVAGRGCDSASQDRMRSITAGSSISAMTSSISGCSRSAPGACGLSSGRSSALGYQPVRRRAYLAALSVALALPAAAFGENVAPATIARVKASIVAVGTFERTRSPAFAFSGSGFAVRNGLEIVTNEHVLRKTLDTERNETLAVAFRNADGSVEVRPARRVVSDASQDLAVLEFDGKPLPALRLGNSTRVREGETYLLTGFPIGAVLGLHPVTHRTMIAAVTPIAIPASRADMLDARAVRQLAAGAYSVFQLDGTAYPGNSGSPLYDAASGEVIGIVNSVLVKGTKESALSQPSGITYAIPANRLEALLERAR
jgi:S1-C subfamily serine protease